MQFIILNFSDYNEAIFIKNNLIEQGIDAKCIVSNPTHIMLPVNIEEWQYTALINAGSAFMLDKMKKNMMKS